jgi:hypothetical protein
VFEEVKLGTSTDKQSSPLSTYILYLTAVIPLMEKPVVGEKLKWGFSNMQDSTQTYHTVRGSAELQLTSDM